MLILMRVSTVPLNNTNLHLPWPFQQVAVVAGGVWTHGKHDQKLSDHQRPEKPRRKKATKNFEWRLAGSEVT